LDKPLPITRAELDALSPGDRAMNREARKQFMIRGPVVNTAQFAAIETEILRRLMLNQYKSHGKLGVIVSGEPNIGKTRRSRTSLAGSSVADATSAGPVVATRSQ
jgi:hypothetical protein